MVAEFRLGKQEGRLIQDRILLGQECAERLLECMLRDEALMTAALAALIDRKGSSRNRLLQIAAAGEPRFFAREAQPVVRVVVAKNRFPHQCFSISLPSCQRRKSRTFAPC